MIFVLSSEEVGRESTPSLVTTILSLDFLTLSCLKSEGYDFFSLENPAFLFDYSSGDLCKIAFLNLALSCLNPFSLFELLQVGIISFLGSFVAARNGYSFLLFIYPSDAVKSILARAVGTLSSVAAAN